MSAKTRAFLEGEINRLQKDAYDFAGEWAKSLQVNERLRTALLAAKREHCKWSCNMVTRCGESEVCTCGAAAHNAAIDEALGNG